MIDQVLQADGDTGEGTDSFSLGQTEVDLRGASERSFVIERDEGVDGVLGGMGEVQGSLHPGDGGLPRHETRS
jgi:hypothetical protein